MRLRAIDHSIDPATPIGHLSAANLPIILRNASFVGLVALGQTLVLLSAASTCRWAARPEVLVTDENVAESLIES